MKRNLLTRICAFLLCAVSTGASIWELSNRTLAPTHRWITAGFSIITGLFAVCIGTGFILDLLDLLKKKRDEKFFR